MGMKIETPPALSGANEQQLRQVYSYLYRLSENLNVALNAMERETKTMAEQAAAQIVKDSTKSGSIGNTYNELRSLIVNTADIVKKEQTVIKEQIDNIATTPVLRIDSSRGTVFKNSAVSTVLTVAIYTGQHRITDITALREVYGASAHLEWSWQKMDDAIFGTILSTDARLTNDGFTFTLSPADVDTKVTFQCRLITD